MYARVALCVSCLFLLAGLAPARATAQTVLPSSFQGYFHWSAYGEQPQDVLLILDEPKIDNGIITANGRELYFTAARFHEAKIMIRVVLADRRFELHHLLDPSNFTDGSCVPDVLVGAISPDLSTIAGPRLDDGDSPAIPDFAFIATRRLAAR